MADNTPIEWCDATWSIITGCSVVSPGCTNCYAMRLAGTRLKHHWSRQGLTRDTKAGPAWTGEVRFNEQWLDQPLRWKRPRRIFVCAHGDLFHESVPDEWIDRVFAVMALAPQHTFQVLTKRAERMREYVSGLGDYQWLPQRLQDAGNFIPAPNHPGDETEPPEWPLPNVWLGVSVEDQARADERIPLLLDTPAVVRFLSCEPMLGPVDLWGARYRYPNGSLAGAVTNWAGLPSIDWVIAGGESGPGARPMHPAWARGLRDQCAAAGVPFHFKQWGEFLPRSQRTGQPLPTGEWGTVEADGTYYPTATPWNGHDDDDPGAGALVWRIGKTAAGRQLDGREHDEMPGCDA